MKRVTIGVALLVAFFLLAIFLMADAEVDRPEPSEAATTQRGG